MNPLALVVLVFSMVLVWGGLITSGIALARKPDRLHYPPGGDDQD